MRATLPRLALGALLLTTGCAGGEGAVGPSPAVPAEDEPTEHVFAAGEQITADLTMYDGDDGRRTPFFSGYRPTIEFRHTGRSGECGVRLPVDLREFSPGETHMVVLECDMEVVVPVDDPGFALVEEGVERGTGEVVPTGEG
ncbi:hypothetical protein ACFWTE_06710 [Nocardiopsis sp. NPDC058631]|uniref:hypothetical protein n=1 Tax=Nocardiopsis sp. NPDC058631 TaxID=3346566 RepID=UPI0036505A7E